MIALVILPISLKSLWIGSFKAELEQVDWAVVWIVEGEGKKIAESYVNLIPTIQGGPMSMA